MNLNKLIGYFDPYSHIRQQRAQAVAGTNVKKPSLHWFPQYLVLTLGVFVEPYLTSYRVNGVWDFNGGFGRALFSLVIAFVIFPLVFRNTVDNAKPLFVLLPPIFTAGLGWQTFMGVAMKAITS